MAFRDRLAAVSALAGGLVRRVGVFAHYLVYVYHTHIIHRNKPYFSIIYGNMGRLHENSSLELILLQYIKKFRHITDFWRDCERKISGSRKKSCTNFARFCGGIRDIVILSSFGGPDNGREIAPERRGGAGANIALMRRCLCVSI